MTDFSSKDDLRTEMKAVLSRISSDQRVNAGRSIAEHLLGETCDRSVLAYASMRDELDLDVVIRDGLANGAKIAIPAMEWGSRSMTPIEITNLDTDLEVGRYDIRVPRGGCTPMEPGQLDVILLPGLAFDPKGNRLGRGAGFYDRFVGSLIKDGHRPTLIGVCYHDQIVESVPTEAHDLRVDRVITELGTLRAE